MSDSPGQQPRSQWRDRWWVIVLVVLALLAVAIAVAVAAGDGDDDSSGSVPTEPVVTEPPGTEPPDTQPPDTELPDTQPATTETSPTTDPPTSETTTSTEPPATTEPPGDPVIGDTVDLVDGGVVRVNSITPDAPARSEFSTPDPGFTFTEIEVEMCAGSDGLNSNPLYWSGFTESNTQVEASLAGNDLQTLGLAPGGCARGWVAVSVPEGDAVVDVVLTDAVFDEIARWSATESVAIDGPLSGSEPPVADELGQPMELSEGATATVRSVTPGVPAPQFVTVEDGRQLVELDVEQCAGSEQLDVNPLYWTLTTRDNYLAGAELVGGSLASISVAPGECVAGTVLVNSLATSAPAFVQLSDPLFDEIGRTLA